MLEPGRISTPPGITSDENNDAADWLFDKLAKTKMPGGPEPAQVLESARL
jgi:hypothetical protein